MNSAVPIATARSNEKCAARLFLKVSRQAVASAIPTERKVAARLQTKLEPVREFID